MDGVDRLCVGGALMVLTGVLGLKLVDLVGGGLAAGAMPTTASRLQALEAAAARSLAAVAPGDVAATALPDVAALAEAAPLHAFPYTVGIAQAMGRGEPDRAVAIAEIATRLDPRSTVPRLVMVQAQINQRDWRGALDMLSDLQRLDPERGNAYRTLVSEIAAQPDAGEAVVSWLASPRSGGQSAAAAVVVATSDLEFAASVARPYPDLHHWIVARYVEQQQWSAAFGAFVDFLAPEQRSAMTVPFDAGFEGQEGARPFNWTINTEFAKLDVGAGLAVTYFGRGRPTIASQVVSLAAGAYSMSVRASGEILEGGGYLEWRAQCVDSPRDVLKLPLTELRFNETDTELEFSVPADRCEFQRLSLVGIPGEYPRTLRAEIRRVTIEPVEQN